MLCMFMVHNRFSSGAVELRWRLAPTQVTSGWRRALSGLHTTEIHNSVFFISFNIVFLVFFFLVF